MLRRRTPLSIDDVGLHPEWKEAYLAHQDQRQPEEQRAEPAPTTGAEELPQVDLEDAVLIDMIELSQLGGGVAWPVGLDARIAHLIVDGRRAAGAARAREAQAKRAHVAGGTGVQRSVRARSSQP